MTQLALVAWIPLTAILFVLLRPHVAAAVSMVFGVALLPSLRAIPLPVLPDLTQYTVPVMASFAMVLIRYPQRLMAARPGRGAEALILAMVAGALVTNLTNTDPQVFASTVLPGMSATDSVNDGLQMIIRWGLPFLLGRALVRTEKEASEVLTVLALAGLFYVPFVLVELAIGPYFHALVYGAPPSPATFWHSLKYGGFRPVVLMNHGLTLSGFMLYSTIAWVGLLRSRVKPFRLPMRPISVGMAVVVAFCKSRAVYIYGVMSIPMLLFARPRLQMLAIAGLATVILTYPFLRSLDLIPVQAVADIAEEYAGYEAAQSFTQRIETEGEILGRTSERYFFGWGGYSRYFVYDPVTGQVQSVMDGFWLIVFGKGGLFRFLTLFVFLVSPVFYALRRIDRITSRRAQVMVCCLSWIVVLRTFDLLPNSTVDPYLTFLGGVTCGLARHESLRKSPPSRANETRKRAPRAPGAPAASAARATSLGSLASRPTDKQPAVRRKI